MVSEVVVVCYSAGGSGAVKDREKEEIRQNPRRLRGASR